MTILQGQEVTLPDMLTAREARVFRQQELLRQYAAPLISFSMNIAGPVKDHPLIRRAYQTGLRELTAALQAARLQVLHQEDRRAVTGCEAILCVKGSALSLKKITTAIEDASPLGRLFDLDVIGTDGQKLDRDLVQGGPRCCIVCGEAGRGCASRRLHSVSDLQTATLRILTEHFRQADAAAAASYATRALLDEVCTTPKPGLVDCHNTGSHQDMDLFTFTASTASLTSYWQECFRLGQETTEEAPASVFSRLRPLGQAAERRMFAATGGINTHKGAVFTLGTVCCAAGRLWRPEIPAPAPEAIAAECARLSSAAMQKDFQEILASSADPGLTGPEAAASATVGSRLYQAKGLTGARGELSDGLPDVLQTSLPVFEEGLASGLSRNNSGAAALLHLIATMTDTNMIARGGQDSAREARDMALQLIQKEPFPPAASIEALDDAFIARHLSPGGCADLLAVTYFLHDWCQ